MFCTKLYLNNNNIMVLLKTCRYLHQTLHNDKIRVHDRNNAFSFALQGNRENLRTVLEFLYSNYREIEEK